MSNSTGYSGAGHLVLTPLHAGYLTISVTQVLNAGIPDGLLWGFNDSVSQSTQNSVQHSVKARASVFYYICASTSMLWSHPDTQLTQKWKEDGLKSGRQSCLKRAALDI